MIFSIYVCIFFILWHISVPYMQDIFCQHMQNNFVDMRLVYVNVHHSYANMQKNYVNVILGACLHNNVAC